MNDLDERGADQVGELAVVFGGGNAVAAYDAGAFEALSAAGHEPDHVAGASAGAVTAVLIAGNPPERRVEMLRRFWAAVTMPGLAAAWMPERWRRAEELRSGLGGRLFGRPALFKPSLSSLLEPGAVPALYDLSPLRETLATLVDFERLNDGAMRVSILALDLASGAEAVFDNRAGRIELDHVLGSCAFLPDFQPIEVAGRILVDGGLAANAPVHLVLDPPRDGLTCFVLDPFPLAAALPKRLLDGQERQTDLLFASQTRRGLEMQARVWGLEARLAGAAGPKGAVWRIEYHAGDEETALKGFSFSEAALDRRWEAGRRDMAAVLAEWDGAPPSVPGLALR